MALGEPQQLSWKTRGCEAMSFCVCVLYASNAALKVIMISKLVVEGETRDMEPIEGWLKEPKLVSR